MSLCVTDFIKRTQMNIVTWEKDGGLTYSEAIFYHPHRRYHYFDVIVELAWSNDPGSYAGSGVVTGRVSLAGQVKGDDPG
jgi:hypothetical protein